MFSMLLMLLVTMAVAAQDVIVKKDGSTILSKVVEVSDTQVKYKKFSNLEGPTYVVSVSELTGINYQNGEKDVFQSLQNIETQIQTSSDNQNVYAPHVRQSGTMSDAELLRMYNYGQKTSANKIKRLKIVGYAGCGLAVLGVAMVGRYVKSDIGPEGIFQWGLTIMSFGAAFGPACLIAGYHKQKINNRLESASLFQQEIPIGSKARLTADVNLLKDKFNKQQTVGLGFHLNF